MGYQWPQDFDDRMRSFMEPRSVAVIGATEGSSYGGRMVENLQDLGFSGKIFPVNPKRSEVKGILCYPSVLDIKEPVDVAAVIIPAKFVLGALEQCRDKGIRSVVIISGGFSERDGQTGMDRQNELKQFATEHGIYICGPNCLGVANVKEKIHVNSGSGIAKLLPDPGSIGVVSQSGATAFGPIVAKSKDRGVRIKYLVSTGNEVNVEGADFIRYMLDDPEVNVIASFIEGFKRGDKIKAVAEAALERKKPIVMMKMGRSEVGQRAAKTHTAAIAGNFQIHEGFFRQKGIIRVDDYDELCETANLFSKGKYPKGNRVGIVSHSGGICTFLSDECASAGFQVPVLSDETSAKIGDILKGWGSAENPLDLTGFARGPQFPEILRSVINDANVDSVILATRGDRKYIEDFARIAGETDKPVVFVWTHSEYDSDGLTALRADSLPVFVSPVKCIKALRHLYNYQKTLQRYHDPERKKHAAIPSSDVAPRLSEVRDKLSGKSGQTLTEGQCRDVLAPLELPFGPSTVCQSVEDAKVCARNFGYPVVLKMDSPQILHKTECQGVYLDIVDEERLSTAYDQIMTCWQAMDPAVTLSGVMVQKMISEGIEVILGVLEDPLFGPTLVLGWGGIFVEAFSVGAWRVCPIEMHDAEDMIEEIPGLSKILSGIRGGPPLDRRALAEIMVRVSEIAHELRDLLHAVDFNPVKILPEGHGIQFLDCRIVLRSDVSDP